MTQVRIKPIISNDYLLYQNRLSFPKFISAAGVTFNMPYQFAMAYANISPLNARREDLNKQFFRKILNNPDNPLLDLLPRDAAIIGRL